ncbi:hypothetical protein AOLI_G00233990 [Acnodon oligacanthus]
MSCTKAVSTDLSMVDISTLEGLRAELAQLRTLVATLEAKLTQREQREHEYEDLKPEVSDVGQQTLDVASFLAELKNEEFSKDIAGTGHHGEDQSTPQELEDALSVPPVRANGQTTAETQQAVGEDENTRALQELEEGPPQCKHEPNPVQMSYTVFSGGDQQTLLQMCSVKLMDCGKMVSLDNHDEDTLTSGEQRQLSSCTGSNFGPRHPFRLQSNLFCIRSWTSPALHCAS